MSAHILDLHRRANRGTRPGNATLIRRIWRIGRSRVGDHGEWLKVGDAADRIWPHGVSVGTIRTFVAKGLLRSTRTGGGHRLISVESIENLNRVLAMPEGDEREAAKTALIQRNRGESER